LPPLGESGALAPKGGFSNVTVTNDVIV